MTIEHIEEPKEKTEEELREARARSYRSVANGLIIHASRFIGTLDIGELHPALLSDFVRLATDLHSKADIETDTLTEHRRRYLETITRGNDPDQ